MVYGTVAFTRQFTKIYLILIFNIIIFSSFTFYRGKNIITAVKTSHRGANITTEV